MGGFLRSRPGRAPSTDGRQREPQPGKDIQAWLWTTSVIALAAFLGTYATRRRKKAEEQLKERTTDLSLLNCLNDAINRGASVDEIVHLLSAATKRIFSPSGSSAYLLTEDKAALVLHKINIRPRVKAAIEKLIGGPIPQVRIPLEGSTFTEASSRGRSHG